MDDKKSNDEICEKKIRETCGPQATIMGIVYLVIFLIALYLSFKRNGGFKLGPFLVALFFPYIYIPYYFATQSKYNMKYSL